jgi:predicted ATPase
MCNLVTHILVLGATQETKRIKNIKRKKQSAIMPNLEGLGLQNFRTFNKKEDFEFAPITLITGTNNAGKSSVFKAIQFLVHNFKDGIGSETLDFKTMKHELGNLERIFNRVTMAAIKNSKIPKSQHMYSRVSDFHKKNVNQPSELPIFEEDEDLVFAFPIKFGGSREISATLEVRYELKRFINKKEEEEEEEEVVVSHSIKSIAVVKNGEYLNWSNIIGNRENYDDSPDWEMITSIDLKKIIQLIIETPFVEINKEFEPNEKTEEYFTIDLFSRIEKYKQTFFDLPFFKKKKDGYESFTEKLIAGKSLFSDYSELTENEKSKLLVIEQTITAELLKGKDNSQYKVLECFKQPFSSVFNGMERDIVSAELKKEQPEEKQKNSEEQNLRNRFTSQMFQTTPNSELFTNLLGAIEKDFLDTVQKKIDSLKKVYFLPTTRGRNREWFIDEQNSEDIQIVRDFSAIYLEHEPQIKEFVNFWIGKGEINELDENGKKKLKGFKIGKELSVFRDEAIGLTKIFLVNFDDTKTPLVDLGYGVSQLLPIIMKIAIIAQNHKIIHEYDFNHQEGYSEKQTIYFNPSTLLIEEPEANLHPSLQSKIAELFIDAASRFNIQFLLETHSEYLIYKFQEYIGRKIVSPNDVKMYYFNHPNDVREGVKDKYISHVKIGKDGSIDYDKYFGKGFFDEQTDLKLSLLNIQRNHFIEDYETIKEELKKSSKTLEGYDAKIEKINQELATATSKKKELEEQLNGIKKEKEEKELELQELIKKQEDIIDEYTVKSDYSKYLAEIERIIDKTKIDNSKTLQYLSTGKYLLKNLDDNADFAPVIIQYGRAVEFEMIKWVNDFKSTKSTADINSLCDSTNYSDKIRKVFIDLGLTLVDDNYEINTDKKVNLFNLKKYIQGNPKKWVFGEFTQVFELFHYISPTKNSYYNYSSVPLMVEFSNYLKNIWTDYNTAEGLFNTCRNILDMRNCAGHTYSASGIIDKSTAEDYVALVEAIFKCL